MELAMNPNISTDASSNNFLKSSFPKELPDVIDNYLKAIQFFDGKSNTALLISQLLYLQRKFNGKTFYQSHKQLADSLCLSVDQIKRSMKIIRETFKDSIVVQLKRVNKHATCHFKLNTDDIYKSINDQNHQSILLMEEGSSKQNQTNAISAESKKTEKLSYVQKLNQNNIDDDQVLKSLLLRTAGQKKALTESEVKYLAETVYIEAVIHTRSNEDENKIQYTKSQAQNLIKTYAKNAIAEHRKPRFKPNQIETKPQLDAETKKQLQDNLNQQLSNIKEQSEEQLLKTSKSKIIKKVRIKQHNR